MVVIAEAGSRVVFFVVGEQIVHGDLMQTVVVNHSLGAVSEKASVKTRALSKVKATFDFLYTLLTARYRAEAQIQNC